MVSMKDAPSGIDTVALNVPSALTFAWTLLTSTFWTGTPSALGATVPVTVTWPAPDWTRLRCGDVTFSTGGSRYGSGPSAQPANARSSAGVKVSRFRMADFTFSKVRANPSRLQLTDCAIRSGGDHTLYRRRGALKIAGCQLDLPATRGGWVPSG